MTDRVNALTVVLEADIRIDDAEAGIIAAIKQLRGVISVRPKVANTDSYIAREQASRELRMKLWEVLKP